MRKKLLDILCALAILALVVYQYILVGIMHMVKSLAEDAASAGDWLGRVIEKNLQKGG